MNKITSTSNKVASSPDIERSPSPFFNTELGWMRIVQFHLKNASDESRNAMNLLGSLCPVSENAERNADLIAVKNTIQVISSTSKYSEGDYQKLKKLVADILLKWTT